MLKLCADRCVWSEWWQVYHCVLPGVCEMNVDRCSAECWQVYWWMLTVATPYIVCCQVCVKWILKSIPRMILWFWVCVKWMLTGVLLLAARCVCEMSADRCISECCEVCVKCVLTNVVLSADRGIGGCWQLCVKWAWTGVALCADRCVWSECGQV